MVGKEVARFHTFVHRVPRFILVAFMEVSVASQALGLYLSFHPVTGYLRPFLLPSAAFQLLIFLALLYFRARPTTNVQERRVSSATYVGVGAATVVINFLAVWIVWTLG